MTISGIDSGVEQDGYLHDPSARTCGGQRARSCNVAK